VIEIELLARELEPMCAKGRTPDQVAALAFGSAQQRVFENRLGGAKQILVLWADTEDGATMQRFR
jgi:hypothetical protein